MPGFGVLKRILSAKGKRNWLYRSGFVLHATGLMFARSHKDGVRFRDSRGRLYQAQADGSIRRA